jgi:hypothetical protein
VIETSHTQLPDWTPDGEMVIIGAANSGDAIAHNSAAYPIVFVFISVLQRN